MSREQVPAEGWMRPAANVASRRQEKYKRLPQTVKEAAE